MTKKPESRKVEPPKPDPKKFIVAFLPRRAEEKIPVKNRRPAKKEKNTQVPLRSTQGRLRKQNARPAASRWPGMLTKCVFQR